MVDQIKTMQRQDPVANEQWYAYCEAYGNNIRDPSKHDVSFIQSFITQYNSGARLEFKEGKELARMIKMGQKKSQAWKTCWEMYANNKPIDGKPKHDPSLHDLNFLEGFFDFVGGMAAGMSSMGGMGGMGMGMMGMGMEPPNKKMRMGGAPQANANSPTVQRIKDYQRMGQAQKEAWHTYCDTNLGGNRDPARHEEAVLQGFCAQYGVP